MNDAVGRQTKFHFPRTRSWRHGYGYKYMHNQPEGPLFFNVDTPYAEQHSRTPDWVGLPVSVVLKAGIPVRFHIIGPQGFAPTEYDPHRLIIFTSKDGIITSLAYH